MAKALSLGHCRLLLSVHRGLVGGFQAHDASHGCGQHSGVRWSGRQLLHWQPHRAVRVHAGAACWEWLVLGVEAYGALPVAKVGYGARVGVVQEIWRHCYSIGATAA